MVENWNMVERRASAEIAPIMSELLGISADEVELAPSGESFDFTLRAIDWKLAVEIVNGAPSTYLSAWERLTRAAPGKWVPALVVPYMTSHGRDLCTAHGINWVDLSGNASLRAPGLRLLIEGRPNKHVKRGRPSSPFAKRALRVTRALLMAPNAPWTLKSCAAASGLDLSQVSRTVQRLIDDELLTRRDGVIRVPSPGRLLDAWRADADFSKHRVLGGTIAARSSDDLVPMLASKLEALSIPAAATGLAAAWQYDPFASFRLASFYVRTWPSQAQLDALHFRESNAPNVWLVVPADDGVFDGEAMVNGVRCVHPVQTYVDLKDHPERAKEAAEHLREKLLNWGR